MLNKKTNILLSFLVLSLFLTNTANATSFSGILDWIKNFGSSGATTLSSVFANLSKSSIYTIGAIKFFAVFVGIILLINAALKLKRSSDGQEKMGNVIWTIISGSLLISFVSVVDVLSNTFLISNSQYSTSLADECNFTFSACSSSSTVSQYAIAGIMGVTLFIKMLGFIGVFKGIYGLYELSKNGGGNSVWKSLVFIVGGVFCINCVALALLMGNTVAPNSGYTEFLSQLL